MKRLQHTVAEVSLQTNEENSARPTEGLLLLAVYFWLLLANQDRGVTCQVRAGSWDLVLQANQPTITT